MIELPELIVGAIRFGLEAAESPFTESEVAERTAGIRDAVPGEHRAAFDELLEEAKLTYRLRDERGTYADLWAIGIMAAILGAGRGLAAQGVIDEPSHLVEADYAELRALLRSGRGLSSEELAGRARYRLEARYTDAPAVIGGEPGEPLPPEWLPAEAARLERALGAVVQEIFMAPQPQTEAHKVRGLGVSPVCRELPASFAGQVSSVASSPATCSSPTRQRRRSTSSSRCSAIVTDRGGISRTRRSSRASTESRAWLAARTPPGCCRTAPSFVWTAPRARVRSSREARAPRGKPRRRPLRRKAAQLASAVGAGLPVPRGGTRSSSYGRLHGRPARIAGFERA